MSVRLACSLNQACCTAVPTGVTMVALELPVKLTTVQQVEGSASDYGNA